MVGLVIVSHSRALAESLVDLVGQVAQNDVALAFAAGVGEGRQEFGTDAVEIAEAIQSVYSSDGVLVLMDLGSAVLSAELSLELLPPDMAPHIRFCAAPLVEGAIAAAVTAGLGSDLDTICAEARAALIPKAEQLGASPPAISPPVPEVAAGLELQTPAEEVTLTLQNEHGLHARPAASFVKLASSFEADIQVRNLTNKKGPVTARSLNALATLGAVRGSEIAIIASGPQAAPALAALRGLVESNFGEPEAEEGAPATRPTPVVTGEAGSLPGIAVSEGIALGPLLRFKTSLPPVPDHKTEDPEAEWARFQDAFEVTRKAIQNRRQALASSLGESQAAIFDAHLLILEDPELVGMVRSAVYEEQANAAQAWMRSIQTVAAQYRALENPYLQQRAVDVEDVGGQLLLALSGESPAQKMELDHAVILVAYDLTPTQTAQLDLDQIQGIITTAGGPTSHSAILARGLGIPAVAGVDAALDAVPEATPLALDGTQGVVWVDPSPEKRQALEKARQAWLAERARLLENTHAPAFTRDGQRIEVAANVGTLTDAEAAVKNGAEGIGLLRTEFLFITRTTPPEEEEQVTALKRIAQTMGERPIIVRTLDVGGDKDLPYLNLPSEANPFLGVRAIRLSLQKVDLFITQLRAILRAADGHQFRIMFPMVSTHQEVLQAMEALEQAHQSLLVDRIPHPWPVETGIMIETPAAALISDILAEQVDFFSIGTNDLTQYTLAAERGNPALSSYADALHPAVLSLIRMVSRAAHAQGKWVGVCGELAGDALAIPALVGLGVDELSMNPGAIPRAKAILRALERSAAEQMAAKLLAAKNAESVRARLTDFMAGLDL